MSMKFLDTVSWPKAALLFGVTLLIVGVFHPPTTERVIAAMLRMTEIISNAASNFGGIE